MYRISTATRSESELFELPFFARAEERGEEREQPNAGKLIFDATCAPADIKYPIDLDLLNQARQSTEKILDCLYQEAKEKLTNKPRNSRKIARKNYLKVAKKPRQSPKQRRKVID